MKETVMVKEVLGLLVVAVVVGVAASFRPGFEDVAGMAWLMAVLSLGFLVGVDVSRSRPVREQMQHTDEERRAARDDLRRMDAESDDEALTASRKALARDIAARRFGK